MLNIQQLSQFGGLFAVLTLIHFIVDWVFQTHAEAMVKHNNALIRAKHCLIYTLGFLPLLLCINSSWVILLLSLSVLFFSHFGEDTYYLVFLWAKHIRKPPEMKLNPKEGFIEFISTPLGKILMITIDQIIHLICLVPVVLLIMLGD